MTDKAQSLEPLHYYRSQYKEDRDAMSGNTRCIYTINLSPRDGLHGHGDILERKDRTLKGIRHSVFFLLCYFFEVLLDQAIHTAYRTDHDKFDLQFNCPKLSGALGSLGYNCNPMNLLVGADLYYLEDKFREVTEPFSVLSNFFLADEYPAVINQFLPYFPGDNGNTEIDYKRIVEVMNTGLEEANIASLGRSGSTVAGSKDVKFDIKQVEELRCIFQAMGEKIISRRMFWDSPPPTL
jgi:hypothetical protein